MLALEINNLHKSYNNGFQALRGVNLRVERDGFFGLLGPNGAGKSTLIGIVSSLINKTQGVVKVFGHDIDKSLNQAKSLIGIVPQEINLAVFETGLDIIINQAGFYGIDRRTAYQRAEKYLNALSLWDKRTEIARNLSGGMKKRLMIARALMHEPKLLILDEPTAGVDIEIRHQMWDFLGELNKSGKAILLTSHYFEEVERLCKNIAIIKEGKIIVDDSVKNVLNKLNNETYILELRESYNFKDFKPDYIKIIDKLTLELSTKLRSDLGKMIAQLVGSGVKIQSIQNKQNRLEEMFLQVTKKNNA